MTDSIIPVNSFLGRINRWARSLFWRKDQTGEAVLDVEGFGMRVVAGGITFKLQGCGVYGTTIDIGNGDMHVKMVVDDAENISLQQLLKTEDEWEVGGAVHNLTRIGDSAVTERRVREWECTVAASMAVTWGAYATAFKDAQAGGGLAETSTSVAEFRTAIDAAKSDIIRSRNDDILDAVPLLADLLRFREKCPSDADELGWINTETMEHTYNDEALDRLPPIIRAVVEKHEAIHHHQVQEGGEPGADAHAHAEYEAEAYQDSVNRLVHWINGECQPGFIPDSFPIVAIAFTPSD